MTEQDRVLAGGGEMGARMRALDWSQTSLGPVEGWPPALRTAVSVMLAAPYPVCLYWGPELCVIYNDGVRPLIGDKHPAALGVPARRMFAEIWDIAGPLFEGVARTQTAVHLENQPLFMNRQGFTEESHFTWSYVPTRDEHGQVVGIFGSVTETTRQVFAERRFQCLRELSIRTALAQDPLGVLRAAGETLAHHGHDVPFALLYRVEEDTARLRLCSGLEPGSALAPGELGLEETAAPWPLAEALRSGEERVLEDLGARGLQAGPWPEPVHRALLLPLALRGGAPDAVLVVGLSPRLPVDESYRDFLRLLARQLAADVTRAHALEQEKQRAAQLAEIDRVKTAFFSNVSHEFRTPLTLMLGPTENALASADQALRGEDLRRVHRNELRLLKLVNTLLDLSRLEAGRTQGRFVPTDLAPLTAGLVSAFDSVMSKAGLRLRVDCPALPEPVWVDPDLWEKIVLNLVSNAFKYTLQGEVAVRLRWLGARVELSVQDTGTGISLEEQPRIFERFHRVEGARGRSDEGTGIGLSLVRELVELHGGSVRVDSTPGQGSIFTVSLPAGQAHLPPERVLAEPPRVSTVTGSEAFLQEAAQWIDPAGELVTELAPLAPTDEAPRGRVLLVDDNADMRDYMARLLQARFHVEAVADGWAALAAARARPPDVVVSDVMMPGLDGFGLVRELKADARTEHVPIMLVSARASERATLEGFSAGIVDYMVKPFRAQELLARTEAIVRTAQAQAESRRLLKEVEAARERMSGLIEQLRQGEERLLRLVDASGAGLWEMDAATGHISTDGHMLDLMGLPPGTPFSFEVAMKNIEAEDREQVAGAVASALAGENGGRYLVMFRTRRQGGGSPRWVESRGQRLLGANSQKVFLAGVMMDITARKQAEAARELAQQRLHSVFMQAPMAICIMEGPEHTFTLANPPYRELMGGRELVGKPLLEALPELVGQGIDTLLDRVVATGEPFFGIEVPVKLRRHLEDGTGYFNFVYSPKRDVEGRVDGVLVSGTDVTDMVRGRGVAERAAHEEKERREFEQQLLGIVSHDLRNPLSAILMGTSLMTRREDLEPRALKSLVRIQSAAERASRMVKDLLDFTQARLGGGLRIDPRPMDLHAVTRGVVEEVEAAYPTRELEVRHEGDGRGAWDADRLAQVVQNLVTNALKYSPEDSRVHVVTRTEKGEVLLSVANGGAPIAADKLGSIFEPMQRATAEIDKAGRSVGLGLYIVKRIVDAHGGRVSVTSTEAEGTVFTVSLPSQRG